MKQHYLLYGLLIAVVVTGCKKNNTGISNTNPNSNGVGNKPKVPILSTKPQLISFKINGANCAYDSITNAYYYPVPIGASLSTYTLNFDTTTAKAILINNIRTKDGATVNYELKTNQQVEIKALNSLNDVTTYNLIVTGLPIVTLSTNRTIQDADVKASFNLVDPDYQAQNSKLQISSNINIAIRGATSRGYPKLSYAVHIVDAAGNDSNVSLLGLRNDNSWILDAMYIDRGRMRNRLCTDIWNSFNNVPYIANEPTALNGTRGYMSEVFLNNKYLGVYCLTEKLDRKQLQIKKQYGNMYKADNWTNETDFTGVSAFSNLSKTWGGWELAYPDLGDTPAPDWGYLYNEVNFIKTATDDGFTNQIKSKVDINNMVDFLIFVNIIRGTDNDNKNTFFSFYDSRSANAFFYSPWDMDSTMGGNAAGIHTDNTIIGTTDNYLLDRLLNLNVGNFKGLIKARWNVLKTNQLNKATVSARIEAYRKILVNTNAFARERSIWPGSVDPSLTDETSFMTNWYSLQYDLVDSYINGL
jgi:hypothetical protein